MRVPAYVEDRPTCTVFEAIAYDLRLLLRSVKGRKPHPSAALPENGHRAGYDGAKRRRGSTIHIAVDTLCCCPVGEWLSAVYGCRRRWQA